MSEANSETATVITQSRGKVIYVLLGAAVFLVLGQWMIAHPESGRHSREYVVAVGVAGSLLGAGGMVAAIMQLFLPAQLRLSPSGLTYSGPYWRRAWAWSEVGEFVIERSYRTRVIKFPVNSGQQVGGDGHQTIPGLWRTNIVEVRDELNAARARWG